MLGTMSCQAPRCIGVMCTGLHVRAQQHRAVLPWQRVWLTASLRAAVPTVEWATDPQASSFSVAARKGRGTSARIRDEWDQQELMRLVAALQCDERLQQQVAELIDSERSTVSDYGVDRDDSSNNAVLTDGFIPVPTGSQLWKLHIRTAVPFIGFGLFDNMIMLTVGGAIEATIGVAFGFSTLAAAGMGQMVSDASGIALQGLIERFADKLGLPSPGLTDQQHQLPMVKSFVLVSRILGIVAGCGIGMFPLLSMPEKDVDLASEIDQAQPSAHRFEVDTLNENVKLVASG